MVRRPTAREREVAAHRDAAITDVQRTIRSYVPSVPECAENDEGLAAWLNAAVGFAADTVTLHDVSRKAWRVGVPPLTLANRFRQAGLKPPGTYERACRLAAVGYAVKMGLAVKEFALSPAAARSLYTVIRTGATPYYPSARVALGVMRQQDVTWATGYFLVPLLLDVPEDAWARPLLLAPSLTRRPAK